MQEQYTKEFEEKKTELQTKVIEIYEASSTEIKVIKIMWFLFSVVFNDKYNTHIMHLWI